MHDSWYGAAFAAMFLLAGIALAKAGKCMETVEKMSEKEK